MRTLGGSFQGTAVILREKLALGEGNRQRHAVIKRCSKGTQKCSDYVYWNVNENIRFRIISLELNSRIFLESSGGRIQ